MARQDELVNIGGFNGLNNVLRPENTPDDYLKTADNVDIDKAGKIHKRKGYSLVDSGDYSSIWSNGSRCMAVKDGDLVEVVPDYSVNLLKESVGDYLSFEEVNDRIYFSSDKLNGIIDDSTVRTWGISIPPSMPAISIVSGTLPEGTYQVSYTYVDEDYIESGAPVAVSVYVPNGSGLSLVIPVSLDARVVSARIYCSTQNGIELFFAAESVPGDSATITSAALFSNPLTMFNLYPAPTGGIIRYFKARMYVARDNVVWYSEAYQYEHFNLDENYVELQSDVVGIMPVEDGVWIASDNLHFAFSANPRAFNLVLKESVKMVKGTETKVSSSYIDGGDGYKWMITTDQGIFILSNQGVCNNVTSKNLSLERGNKGSGLFVQDRGINQYLSTIQKKAPANNAVMGDIVTGTIVRNGIVLQE